jgi:transglutaminase-like putative cysteine protease
VTSREPHAIYLAHGDVIDAQHPEVAARARELALGCASDEAITERCFLFVRDAIKHSWDFRLNPVTCKASDVLRHGTGFCYAKSHLLAALLRANGIPAALCYQRLSVGTEGPPYCLHGLNAVYLERFGWYRLDARGNKPGVDSAFVPPVERLAFPPVPPHEYDLEGLHAEPLAEVLEVLGRSASVEEVASNLPDVIR